MGGISRFTQDAALSADDRRKLREANVYLIASSIGRVAIKNDLIETLDLGGAEYCFDVIFSPLGSTPQTNSHFARAPLLRRAASTSAITSRQARRPLCIRRCCAWVEPDQRGPGERAIAGTDIHNRLKATREAVFRFADNPPFQKNGIDTWAASELRLLNRSQGDMVG